MMRYLTPLLLWFGLLSNACGQEAILLDGPGSVKLKAWHYKAGGDTAVPKPVVIALHGCGGLYATAGVRKGQLNARHHAMGQMLQTQGYHAIFPDSYSSRGIEGTCSEVQRLNNGIRVAAQERRLDTLATLAWVRSQVWADVGRNNVGLIGWSQGAQTLLAATDAGHAEVKTTLPVKTAIAFYPGCVDASREGYRPNAPIAFLLGADDDWTLPEPCVRLAQSLQSKGDQVTLKVYPGAVHGFDTPIPGIRTVSEIPSRSPARVGLGVQVGQNSAAREESWALVRDILKRAFAQ
jgi:dienelactone hydrolase